MRLETRIILDRPRLFLVADRTIKKNEILYWNYNAKGTDELKHYNYVPFYTDL